MTKILSKIMRTFCPSGENLNFLNVFDMFFFLSDELGLDECECF